MFSIDGDYNNLRNSKIYFVVVKLESRELNLVLRKTGIIVRHARAFSNQAVFVKYCPDFKIFSQNHERNIKIDFLINVLLGWTFQ